MFLSRRHFKATARRYAIRLMILEVEIVITVSRLKVLTMLSNRPGGARIGAKIPDWMSNNLAGRKK